MYINLAFLLQFTTETSLDRWLRMIFKTLKIGDIYFGALIEKNM